MKYIIVDEETGSELEVINVESEKEALRQALSLAGLGVYMVPKKNDYLEIEE